MIHTTIGIYNNGDYKTNGVLPEDLQAHIDYNIENRWGRALVVDGKIVYCGYLNEEGINEILDKNNLRELKHNKCTAPYH